MCPAIQCHYPPCHTLKHQAVRKMPSWHRCCTKQRDGFSSQRTYYESTQQETIKGHSVRIYENNGLTWRAEKVSAKQQLNQYQAETAIPRFFYLTFYLVSALRNGLIFCIIVLFFSLPARFSDKPVGVKDEVNKNDPNLKTVPFCKADWVWVTKLRIHL